MPQITRIKPGRRFCEAIVCGGMVYISGQVDVTYSRTTKEQTKEVLKTIDELLEKAGSDKKHILRCTVYLSNMGSFSEMNEAWEEWAAPDALPTRSVLESALPDPSWKVQISTIAVVKNSDS